MQFVAETNNPHCLWHDSSSPMVVVHHEKWSTADSHGKGA
jgi:hypothetical protein